MGNDLYLAVFILLIKFSHASIKMPYRVAVKRRVGPDLET